MLRHCGETCCRGEVSTADYDRCDVRRTWSDRLADALPRVTAVPQPRGDLLATFSPAYRRAHARPVDLPARAGHRPGAAFGAGAFGADEAAGFGAACGAAEADLGGEGALGVMAVAAAAGGGVGLVAQRLARNAGGLGPVGDGGQRVADRAGAAARAAPSPGGPARWRTVPPHPGPAWPG
jgi:hypothetical protein